MKKQILLCLLTGLLSASSLYATAYTAAGNETNATQQTSRIDLKGDYDNKGGGFRSGADPIVAELQDNMLSIRFQKDVGVLQVTVTGPQGQVYTTAVNTETPSVLSIPLLGLPTGNYTVTFSNERGMMWGEFEV